jgi:uncharacterized C2H2 Zn-finger protein
MLRFINAYGRGRSRLLDVFLLCTLTALLAPTAVRAQEEGAREERTVERRGIHVMMGSKSSLPQAERLITELAPALGFNWIILEVGGQFAYQSHPEVAEPDSIDAEDARRLARLARENGIHLVPEYQCLGHQSWGESIGALLRAHPEFEETGETDTSRSRRDHLRSWCPNNPEVYRVVFDLIDELIEAFEADAFHVGMDEVFVLGRCPRCKGTRNAKLYAKAVNDLHGHIVGKRGLEMMMWGDRLLPPTFGYNRWEGSHNDTWAAVDLVPKDIVICDWHYGVMEDYPSVRYLQGKGFRVWPAGWDEEAAVRRLIEMSRRDAAGKMVGYLATTWIGIDELVPALAGDETAGESRHLPGVVAAVKAAAELETE